MVLAFLLLVLASLLLGVASGCTGPSVRVLVKRARSIPNSDFDIFDGGAPDVRAKVKLGTRFGSKLTRVIMNDNSPSWNTAFCFPGQAAVDEFTKHGVRVTLWDADILRWSKLSSWNFPRGGPQSQRQSNGAVLTVKATVVEKVKAAADASGPALPLGGLCKACVDYGFAKEEVVLKMIGDDCRNAAIAGLHAAGKGAVAALEAGKSNEDLAAMLAPRGLCKACVDNEFRVLAETLQMSDDDCKNTVAVELSKAGRGTVAALAARSNAALLALLAAAPTGEGKSPFPKKDGKASPLGPATDEDEKDEREAVESDGADTTIPSLEDDNQGWTKFGDTAAPGNDLRACAAAQDRDIRDSKADQELCKTECVKDRNCVGVVFHEAGSMLKRRSDRIVRKTGCVLWSLDRAVSGGGSRTAATRGAPTRSGGRRRR